MQAKYENKGCLEQESMTYEWSKMTKEMSEMIHLKV